MMRGDWVKNHWSKTALFFSFSFIGHGLLLYLCVSYARIQDKAVGKYRRKSEIAEDAKKRVAIPPKNG
jgi:hypothetical protein